MPVGGWRVLLLPALSALSRLRSPPVLVMHESGRRGGFACRGPDGALSGGFFFFAFAALLILAEARTFLVSRRASTASPSDQRPRES